MQVARDLEALFREAGAAEAMRREAARVAEREQRRKRVERARVQRADRERATAVAKDVWAWVVGDEARALRVLMRSARLEELPLLGWMGSDGRLRSGAFSGAWKVRLTASGAITVFHLGLIGAGGMGSFTTRIKRAAHLAQIAPPGVIFALDRAIIKSGAIHRHIREHLRDLRDDL